MKKKKWKETIDLEIKVIEKNKTWELTKLSKTTKSYWCQVGYKIQYKQDGSIDQYKTRLIVKGYK